MSRNLSYSALTLRVKPSGGVLGGPAREAWFLTSEEGIIHATVFGGPKSRLRSLVAPFHSGILHIYHDPVRNSSKVSEFDVTSYRTGLRELWERAMTAGAAAETILASHGGGGAWAEALKLAENVLDALDTSDAALSSRIGIHFLWQWAKILGVRPDLSACASCGGEAGQARTLWYSPNSEALLCENCKNETSPESSFRLGPGAMQWLKATGPVPPQALSRISLDAPSLEQARAFTKAVMAAALGKRLPTWDEI